LFAIVQNAAASDKQIILYLTLLYDQSIMASDCL